MQRLADMGAVMIIGHHRLNGQSYGLSVPIGRDCREITAEKAATLPTMSMSAKDMRLAAEALHLLAGAFEDAENGIVAD